MRKIAVNVCRLVLAVAFILSGFVKAVDPLGTQYKIHDYLTAWGLASVVPDFVTLAVSVVQSSAEFFLGICLLFAIRRRLVSLIVLILMVVMTLLTLWLAIANPISDCGCFGDALVLTNWQTFWKNVVLLAAAIVVRRYPLDMGRIISRSNQWIVMNYSAFFILVIIAGRSLYTLPQFDFRPYHIGTNLREGWQRMIEGEDSPYAEFFIESMDEGEDITEQVLQDQGYTFLLVSPHLEQADDSQLDELNRLYEYPHLEQADDSQLDELNRLYEYSQEHGYRFYCLTASGQRGISRWQDITGAEYPFCLTDETTLKTVIRSNPGLLLLKDGVIIQKWSHNALPTAEETSGPLEASEIGDLPSDNVASTALRQCGEQDPLDPHLVCAAPRAAHRGRPSVGLEPLD